MRWVFAFLIPPVAVLLCGRPVQFIFNLIVWLVSIPLLFFGIGFTAVEISSAATIA